MPHGHLPVSPVDGPMCLLAGRTWLCSLSLPQASLPASRAQVARGSERGWWGPTTLSLESPSGAQVEGTALSGKLRLGSWGERPAGGRGGGTPGQGWRAHSVPGEEGTAQRCPVPPPEGTHLQVQSRPGVLGGQDANVNFGGHDLVLNACSLQCLVTPNAVLSPFTATLGPQCQRQATRGPVTPRAHAAGLQTAVMRPRGKRVCWRSSFRREHRAVGCECNVKESTASPKSGAFERKHTWLSIDRLTAPS